MTKQTRKKTQRIVPSDSDSEDTFIEDTQAFDDEQNQAPVSPAVQGELSASGDMPDPDSDDDTLQNAHIAGFQMDEDLEHPEEIDIARDVDKAEEYVRTH